MTVNGPPQPLRFYVLSHPRTASNLFCKLFSQHPKLNLQLHGFAFEYQFGPDAQTLMRSKEVDELNKIYRDICKEMSFQVALDKLEKQIADTEAVGKLPFLKDPCCLITDSAQAQKLLKRHRDVPPKPAMIDRMLDIPEDKRKFERGSPYVDRSGEHCNPTILPDRLMKTCAPIFTIRHPANQVESWYKVSRIFGLDLDDVEFELSATFAFSRRLYEFYANLYDTPKQNGNGAAHAVGRWPVVIDGDDLINDTEGIANKFCEVAGLDPSDVIYKWEQVEFTKGSIEKAFYGQINKSEGVKKNLNPKRPNLAESFAKWREEWGDEVASALLNHANDAMADYEYLYQFRL